MLLEHNAEVRQRWQARVHYLLVDEYQDTNVCQYRLVQWLTGQRAMFTAVGDDDQAIYAWRGATVENLANLTSDYRSEEHTSELQSLMRISYAVFCLKKKNIKKTHTIRHYNYTILLTNKPDETKL